MIVMKQSRTMTLLMTRPLPGAQTFAAALQEELPDLKVIYSPVLQIVPAQAPELKGARGLVFTSQNGVHLFAQGSTVRDIPAFCLGERTTQAARDIGLQATQVGHNAETLVSTLHGENPPTPLLHLRGEHSVGDVAARLTDSGLMCQEQVIYRQKPLELTAQAQAALSSNDLIILPIFSPRSARLLADQCQNTQASLIIGWMSEAVRAAWVGPKPMAEAVADHPDAEALRKAVLGAIATAVQLEGHDAQR
ncbi:uroporphyrinogen III methyltransferase [Actibacterium pelagium]|uniref:Uroporphyrinogen III methyltransferase n=1 Tax=Actibacterium pelagium TaxID=2029103 RepID=A0A917EK57_9RHOB|nr:uroporphyrinogen III methyltransferase [Actibacterium pelagium]